eukprot:gene13924-14041_t
MSDVAIENEILWRVEGAGSKAFCAGGDIRRLYDQGKAGDHASQLTFWREEYRLNIRIRLFAKPFISLIDGIVMGGGVGLSQHGTLRVIGEKYLFAMPEVGIGFFPDVGATYFLPRLKNDFGVFLGLTGARVKAGDALACGLADHFVPSGHFFALKQRLIAGQHYRQAVADEATAPPAPLVFAQWPALQECFQPAPAVTILARLAVLAPRYAEAQRILDDLRTKSPFSLALTAQQILEGARQKGLRLDLPAAMEVEYRMVSRIIFEPDFYEGIRTGHSCDVRALAGQRVERGRDMKPSGTVNRAKQVPLVVLPQPPISAKRDVGAGTNLPRWGFLLVWFMRLAAVVWMFKGLLIWCGLLHVNTIPPIDLSNLPLIQAAIILFFSVFDLVAAVGLWLAAPWGGVLWLAAVIAEIASQIVVYHSFIDLWTQNLINLLMVASYFTLSWLAAYALDQNSGQ